MLTAIKEDLPDTKIMLITPFVVYPNGNADAELLEKRIAAVTELANVYADAFFPAHELFAEKAAAGEAESYSDDGIHPNAAGAKLLGEAYAAAVEPLLT